MNRDAQIQAYNEPTYVQASADAGQPQQVNLFKLVHRLLRGRYAITVILAVLLGAAGAVGGYMSSEPKYKAEATIRIQPVIPKILYDTDQSTLQTRLSSYVSTQAYLLRQPRVLDRAKASQEWRSLGRPITPTYDAEFADSLKVTTVRDAPELIFVSFVDKDARAAFIGVNEVVRAYEDIEIKGGPDNIRTFQLTALTDRRRELENERRALETKIRTESQEFETSDLATLHNHSLQEQLRLDTRVGELAILLAERGVDPSTAVNAQPAPDASVPAPAPVAATAEEIAQIDRQMAQYFDQRAAARQVLNRLRSAGVGEKHSDFVTAQSDLNSIETLIADYAEQWNQRASSSSFDTPAATLATETTDQLVNRYRLLLRQSELWRQRTEKVNVAKTSIDGYRSEIERLNQNIAEVNRRMDALNLESKMEDKIARVDVREAPAPPSVPNVDSRKKLAAFGLVAGAGLPIALMLLLGLIDRRLRYSDQADGPALSAPMLGVLPYLPGDGADPNQVAAAVHGVHHIRTLLQLASNKRQHRVYAVTSPTAGDGKTSLSLSLAMSFSAAGSRTALIDFDLIGQGLSSRLKLATEHGIGEALASGHLNGSCSMHTPFPGLTVMGPKPEEIDLVSRLSGDNVAKVIEELRESFDTVIVDTGPILGSLEATMACSSADAVVLVVGRGQHQPNIQSALNKLVQIGANCVGLVFNRAHSADFNRSAGTMSMRSVRTAEIQRTRPASDNPLTKHLDPLTRSMAAEIDRPALP